MASILKNPTRRAKLGKHGHDMSKTRKFSAAPGQLLPMYMDVLYPGDKVYLGEELIARTQDLSSAAMVDLTQHVDYFFVPFEQIYKPFGSFISQVNDINSSLISPSDLVAVLPYFSCESLALYLREYFQKVDEELSPGYQNLPADMKDIFGIPNPFNLFRLAQLFGLSDFLQYMFNNDKLFEDFGQFSFVSSSFAFMAAYQKIYFDYYRLSDREANDPSYYSLDRFYNLGKVGNISDIMKFFTMRYRPMKKDFFTSVQVSPMFGPDGIGALPNNTLRHVQQWLTGKGDFRLNVAGTENDPQTGADGNYGSVGLPLASLTTDGVNVPNITAMFALNKMLEVTRRAGKHYDRQMLAHFGVDVPTGISGQVMYLGSHQSKIIVGDVLATANGSAVNAAGESSSSFVGQVGGKGYGYDKNGAIDFTAPAHGVIMAIYSVVPEVEYKPTFDRLNSLLYPYDFYQPEMDNLGMQPLFAYQGDMKKVLLRNVESSSILGWQYRYSESKLKFDDVTGAFTTSLSYWSPSKEAPSDTALDNFIVPPYYLNNVMEVRFAPYLENGALGVGAYALDPYAEDPVFGMIHFNVKKVSSMSTYGLLNL